MSYIKLYRKVLDWEWFTDIPTFYLWIYILLKANYKDTVTNGIAVKKGSFLTSLRKMAEETGMNLMAIRRSLAKLEVTHEITTNKTHQGTVITVNKWALYQGGDEKVTHQMTRQPTHTLSNKNDKNDEDIYINTFVEAGYDPKFIETCVRTMHRFGLEGYENLVKVVDIMNNRNILNKEGYLFVVSQGKDN